MSCFDARYLEFNGSVVWCILRRCVGHSTAGLNGTEPQKKAGQFFVETGGCLTRCIVISTAWQHILPASSVTGVLQFASQLVHVVFVHLRPLLVGFC